MILSSLAGSLSLGKMGRPMNRAVLLLPHMKCFDECASGGISLATRHAKAYKGGGGLSCNTVSFEGRLKGHLRYVLHTKAQHVRTRYG